MRFTLFVLTGLALSAFVIIPIVNAQALPQISDTSTVVVTRPGTNAPDIAPTPVHIIRPIEIVRPTNGSIFKVSDAIYEIPIEVQTSGTNAVKEAIVFLDGKAIQTNLMSNFVVSPYIPTTAGEHSIIAVANGYDGVGFTNEIRFTVIELPFFISRVQIARQNTNVIVTFQNDLQSSSNLVSWTTERVSSPATFPTTDRRRFFRARN